MQTLVLPLEEGHLLPLGPQHGLVGDPGQVILDTAGGKGFKVAVS